ncbi:ANTAR domain-containing protein [Mycobacterium sp. CBMA293]|uniref:PAS and ANTAR domain-containing protein n=1 Tax=unclassified Mycolicibacterium TaxID=2636767 RepID=UPI0012DCDFC0|nr:MULTISPECIES: PAS and ANTAR domain-containing protein [unclassified Mycolicibacterium]MUL48734.1 ANTAR domain-containing protein [Mycolicibacterium sp. CBMA 360]MUL62188.1 ANTAR domain-containing protein [Mycolicibacterium sp. CBMA 335]MUL71649.1 ANTAR domain-containing protein [Mycolicibacterium sp. CBMA 311]MUL93604.1 ANTAR domain-containing protein [Mycolicibacterium sp. CBMA 230]MUM09284.1 antitermination regulator [Mycolicibacterium sp. CBMA 213]
MTDTPVDSQESWDVAAVFSGGESQRVGRFRYFVANQRWVWSDQVARMHGYEPGAVEPTTELLLSHQHPDDRAKVAEILERVKTGGQFSSRHRVIDASGCTRWMVVVGDRMIDESGDVIGTEGFYVDVTDSVQSDLTKAMSGVVESRALIEQAKGVLMVAYGVDADRAFDILKWRSQTTQVKLKTVAAQLLHALMRQGLSAESTSAVDRLLVAGTGLTDD